MIIIKCYSEMLQFQTFKERYEYLRIPGIVGRESFGGRRLMNQAFYRSKEWKATRRKILLRDEGCDMGLFDFPISGEPIIHHINPITIEDIELGRDIVFDPENLISVAFYTHNAIHFGSFETISGKEYKERVPNDTCPWR